MEFASEMIALASIYKLKIGQVSTTLKKSPRALSVPLAFFGKQVKKVALKSSANPRFSEENFVDSKKISVIAEVKKASPSKGVIRKDFSPKQIAKQYESSGATCLSILTDEEYFQGSIHYLMDIRSEVKLPLLRKDFIIDEYQIYQSRLFGADCILLIVSILSDDQLGNFKKIAESLNLDVLVEIHDLNELDRIRPFDFPLIGINNRNLSTFEVDLETTKIIAEKIPHRLVVSESGIKTKSDINQIVSYDVRNFLVGESFMRAQDPGQELKRLFFS